MKLFVCLLLAPEPARPADFLFIPDRSFLLGLPEANLLFAFCLTTFAVEKSA